MQRSYSMNMLNGNALNANNAYIMHSQSDTEQYEVKQWGGWNSSVTDFTKPDEIDLDDLLQTKKSGIIYSQLDSERNPFRECQRWKSSVSEYTDSD